MFSIIDRNSSDNDKVTMAVKNYDEDRPLE